VADQYANVMDETTGETSISATSTTTDGIVNGKTATKKVNLLVKYKANLSTQQQQMQTTRSSFNSTKLNKLTRSKVISDKRNVIEVEVDEEEKDDVVGALLREEDVWLVEEDFLVHKLPISPSSEQASHQMHVKNSNTNNKHANLRRTKEIQQYGLDLIQAPLVWEAIESNTKKYTNTPVKVCIIDTGYDYGNEDLPTDDVTSTETKYGDAFIDGDGHGTHCAGVIGAIGDNDRGVIGVNPDPTKFSLHISKALNAQGIGTASSLIQAIEGCMESGSKIISMSLGGGPNSDIFREIYKEAYDEGILIFGAAGNQGSTDHDYPASFPHVVSVGAVNQNGKRAPFSNFNDQVELMAPGVEVLSTYPNDSYFTLSGTSMATPYVAGVAALVWGYFPECSNHQIRNVLALTAKTMSKNNLTCDFKNGYGLVQAKDAFDMLEEYGCDAGGEDPDPLSDGGVGGCAQALPELNELSIQLTPQPSPKPTPNTGTVFFFLPIDTTTQAPTSGTTDDICRKLQVDLYTDQHAIETSWTLERIIDDTRQEIKSGPPSNMNYVEEKHYSIISDCLVDGSYEFTVYDEFGDGINAPGYYTIYLDGEVLATNSNFGSSETTRFLIESSTPVEVRQPTDEWVKLMYEDFIDGLGTFSQGGDDVLYANEMFGRQGLVCIQDGSNFGQANVYSNDITLDQAYSRFKVIFSYRASGMEEGERFCLDYSSDGGSSWSKANCWRSGLSFYNGVWYDDVSVVFQPKTVVDSISVRFRGLAGDDTDRVYLDQVQLLGRS